MAFEKQTDQIRQALQIILLRSTEITHSFSAPAEKSALSINEQVERIVGEISQIEDAKDAGEAAAFSHKYIGPTKTTPYRWDRVRLWLRDNAGPYVGNVRLCNGTQWDMVIGYVRSKHNGSGVICGVIGKGLYHFYGYASAGYVSDKLNILLGDGGNIADIINYLQMSVGTYEKREQGRYQDHLTQLVCDDKNGHYPILNCD